MTNRLILINDKGCSCWVWRSFQTREQQWGVYHEGQFALPVSEHFCSQAWSASSESEDKLYHDLWRHEFLEKFSLPDCTPENVARVGHLFANSFVVPQSEHCINQKLWPTKKGFYVGCKGACRLENHSKVYHKGKVTGLFLELFIFQHDLLLLKTRKNFHDPIKLAGDIISSRMIRMLYSR